MSTPEGWRSSTTGYIVVIMKSDIRVHHNQHRDAYLT